uniref:Metal-Dependent Hydrolase n=1 Tax=Florenciella sp. virus SA2 TaxID=3240092 RepID=A0AB39JE67_9VIRU
MDNNILFYVLILFMFSISIKLYYDSDTFQLKCIVSDINGKKYCVRERTKIKEASNLLATTTEKLNKLVDHLHKKYPEKKSVVLLYNNYNPKKIKEILPTSEYTAYSENKGEKIAFCLSKVDKNDVDNLIEENTLMFVALHEISHLATETIGHDDEFWNNFKFIIQEAKKINVYQPIDYKKNKTQYCGTIIKDNPYYDL